MIGWGEEMRPALLLHRTARTVPLACEHTAWGLDERGMARQHRRYTSILVFFAPWRENMFGTQRRNGDSTPDGSRHSAFMRNQNQGIPPIGPRHQEIATRERHVLQQPITRDQQLQGPSAPSNDRWVALNFEERFSKGRSSRRESPNRWDGIVSHGRGVSPIPFGH